MDINLGLSASATGTVDVITATYSPAPTLVDKKILFLVASGANTSTTPTFSPNGLTAHTITKLGGSPLVAGDIAGANFVAILVYNLANTRWELLNPATAGVTATTVQSGSLLAGVASGTDTYLVTLTPALSAYATTNVFFVKFTNANTGASTINFNTLGDIPIKKNATVALSSGDIIAGAIYRLAYDGTNFQIDLASVGVWQNWTPTLAGWTSATPTVAHSRYTLNGKMLTFSIFVAGQSSNATTASFTIPFNAAQTTRLTNGVATNSGAGQATPLRSDFVAGSNVVTIYKSPDASPWTAGGSLKGFNMTGTIEIQ